MGVLIQKKQPIMKAVFVFAALVVFAAVATAEFQPGEEEFIETTELRRPGVKGCHLKCKPRQCSVTIYQHCNYRGYRINLKPGSYNMHQLQRKHMKNDDISSIRFHGRCTARLYEHWKFTGKTWNIGRNDSCFTNNHMKEFSMLQIAEEPTQETELVQAEFGRFRGRRRRISWNDQMSSMKVSNHAGKVCHYDCRARNAKERATKKKAAAARKRAAEKAAKALKKEKSDKAHKKKVAEKKRKADMKKEKAAKKRAEKANKVVAKIRAAEKRTKKAIAAQKKKRAEKRTKREKKHKAFWKKRAAERKKKNAKREKRMKAQFKKKKKVAKCEVKAKGHKANRLKGMCRAYLRFCKLYKRYGLHDDAARHCKNAARMHKALVKHMKKHHKKHKKGKKMDQLAEFVQDLF